MDLNDSSLPNDTKTKNYVNQIDKALKGFEYSSVWADLISNLGKLMKVLNAHSSFQFVPKKVLIAKRLAQCLHPALPSGVHLKTLECYKIVFSMIPRENLANDMSLFGNGLLSLFNNSAMSVKPKLFDLVEEFLLPMRDLLHPLMPGIIQGFLPCLEDGSEFYDRGIQILTQLSKSIGREKFYTSLWQVIILNPSVRIFAISFILYNYNKKMPLFEQLYILGNDSDVLTIGLCSLLEDSLVLVQRNSLDFLLNSLPLYRLDEEKIKVDKTRIILSSLIVLLQRDAYLNRRLISWYFGTHVVSSTENIHSDVNISSEADYFANFTKSPLVKALHRIIEDPKILFCQSSISCEKIVFSRLFRLFSALLDNPEIGPSISGDIIFQMLNYCYAEYDRIKEISKIPKSINQLALVHMPKSTKIKGLHSSMEATLRNYQTLKTNVKNEGDTRHFEKLLESQKKNQKPTENNSILSEFTKTMNDFFSRLETKFLWTQLSTRLTQIIESSDSLESCHREVYDWSVKTAFLINTLPMNNSDSDVGSRHLPEMILEINKAITFILSDYSRLENSDEKREFLRNRSFIRCTNGLINIYKTIIEFIVKINICISDLDNNPEDKSTKGPMNITLSGISSQRLCLQLYTKMILGLRKILTQFVQVIFNVSTEDVVERLELIDKVTSFSSIDRVIREYQLHYFIDDNLDSITYYNEWICLFTEIIRLVISFTEIPLILEKNTNFDRNQVFDEIDEDSILFHNMKYNKWIANIMILAIFTKKSNIKFIIANGLLDLLQAGLSVHGWDSIVNHSEERKEYTELFMMMPVLGCGTMQNIIIKSNFISYTLISLWPYFSLPETSSEDSVCLMYRMFDFISLTKKSHSRRQNIKIERQMNLFEEFLIDRLQSLDVDLRYEAFQNFKTIWELSCPIRNKNKSHLLSESWQYDIINLNKPTGLNSKFSSKYSVGLSIFQKCSLFLLDSIEVNSAFLPLNEDCATSTSDDSGRCSNLFTNSNLTYPMALLSREWLNKTYEDDQMIRLLIPILSSLLAPNTSRVSLVHINRDEEKTSKTHLKSTSLQVLSSQDDSSNRNENESVGTHESLDFEENPDLLIKNLFAVNTNEEGDLIYHKRSYESEPIYSYTNNHEGNALDDLKTRIKTYHMNGESESFKIHELAHKHMDDILIRNQNEKNFQIMTTFLNGDIFPVHKHMLIYTQNVDLNQILYSIKRLRTIFDCIGPKFLVALVSQSILSNKNTSASSIYLQKKLFYDLTLVEIISRHFDSIYGENFYDNPDRKANIRENMEKFQCHNLFDVLLNQLVWILSSYCPTKLVYNPTSNKVIATSTQNYLDEPSLNELSAANLELKLTTLDLLSTIIKNAKMLIGDFVLESGSNQMNLVIPEPSKMLLLKNTSLAHDISMSLMKSPVIPIVLHSVATTTNLSQCPASDNYKTLFLQYNVERIPVSFNIDIANHIFGSGQNLDQLKQKITLEQNLIIDLCSIQSATSWIVLNKATSIVGGAYVKSKQKSEINLRPCCWWPEHSLKDEKIVRDSLKNFPYCLKKHDAFMKMYLSEYKYGPYDWITNQPLLYNTLRSAMNIPKCMSLLDEEEKLQNLLIHRLDIQISWFRFLERVIPLTTSAKLPAYIEVLTLNSYHAIKSLVSTPIYFEKNLQNKLEVSVKEKYIPVPKDYLRTIFESLTAIYHAFLLSDERSNLLAGQLGRTINLEMEKSSLNPRKNAQEAIPQSWEFYSNTHLNSAFNLEEVFKTMKSSGEEINQASTLNGTIVNWIMIGRCRLIESFPKIIQCMAMIWDSLNFHTALVESFNRRSDSNKSSTSSATTFETIDIPSEDNIKSWQFYLKYFASFGKSTLMRQMIRDFLEPISSTHASAFLVGLSLAWPDTLLANPFKIDPKADNTQDTIPPPSINLLNLLEPTKPENETLRKLNYEDFYASGITLNGLQCALISLLAGRITVTTVNTLDINQKSQNKYSDDAFNYDPLIGPSEIVLTMKEILKNTKPNYPTTSMIISFPTCLGMSPSLEFDISEYTAKIQPSRIQINILHLLYSWISLSDESLSSVGLSPTVLLSFLKDITSIEVTSSIQITSQVNLLNQADEIINVSDDVDETSKSLDQDSVLHRAGSINNKNDTSQSYNQTVLMPNNLPPIANFILLKIFNELLVNVTLVDEKREQRDYQDICLKILESIAQIASSAMEQPTWYRRTYQVRQGLTMPAAMCNQSNSSLSSSFEISVNNEAKLHKYDHFKSNSPGDLTIQSFNLLTKHLIILFDVVYKSEEKDKISSILISNIFPLIFPYLRVRYLSNMSHFDCASQLIASLSSYQFTRRAWRKEIFELFMDNQFFQMLPKSLFSWMTIVDNLMTQDKNTLKEAMTRLTFSQTGGLNLFSNKEAEDESRAAILKKLSFIIFSSDPDQYTRSMNELLERLTDCIRSLNGSFIEPIHSQIFLFTRVILLRIPANNLYSLWHLVIPEMIYIFNEFILVLKSIIKSKNGKLSIDNLSSKLLNSVLSASKVLATALLLGEDNAPQFSYNRWVFISQSVWRTLNIDSNATMSFDENENRDKKAYRPLVEEISVLLKQYCEMEFKSRHSKDPDPIAPYEACLSVLSMKSIESARPLLLFFMSLSENKTYTMTTDKRNARFETCIVESSLEASIFNEYPESISTQNQ